MVNKNKDRITLIKYRIYHVGRVNLHLLIDEEQTVLRKNTSLALFGNIETTGKIPNDTGKGVNFLLCPLCFWCASYLSSNSASFAKCPSCIEGNIETIPIAENENYSFKTDIKRGITMEFFR